MAPTSFGDQSTSRHNGFLKLGHTSTGVAISTLFRALNACWQSRFHTNAMSLFVTQTMEQPTMSIPKHNFGNIQSILGKTWCW